MKIKMVNKFFFVVLVVLFAAKDYLIEDGSGFYGFLSAVVIAAFFTVMDWSDGEEENIGEAIKTNPRAWKLMKKKKDFVVVASDELYYMEVYGLIRFWEIDKGRWSSEDAACYSEHLKKYGEFHRSYLEKLIRMEARYRDAQVENPGIDGEYEVITENGPEISTYNGECGWDLNVWAWRPARSTMTSASDGKE